MQYVRNPNGTGTAEISLILFSIYLGWPGINNNGAVKMPTSSSVDIDRLIYWSDWRLRYVHQTKFIVTHNTYSCNAEYLRNLTVYIRDIKRRRRIGRIFRATGKKNPQRWQFVRVPRNSTIYFLPQIHKPNNLGCSIVSANNCPTEIISQYLDRVLTPTSGLPPLAHLWH